MRRPVDVFEHAVRSEARHERVSRLHAMNRCELRALLAGDPRKAAPWVLSAAEYGLPAAQLRLGRMLLEGEGVSRDRNLAMFWFMRASEQGDADAMNMLGRCHENGWGTVASLEKAAQWYELSASRGHDWGEYNFGNVLFDGRGTRIDRQEALRWYRRAARQGHSRAMNLLGRCLEEGWGCSRSPVEALDWYRQSAESGYFRGQFNYAVALLECGLVGEADPWLWQAARLGTHEVRRAIARLLSEIADPNLKKTADRVTRLMCEETPV